MTNRIALAVAAVFVSGGIAIAAQQGAAAKKLLVKNASSSNRKIMYLSKNTTATVVGDPTVNGASFNIALIGTFTPGSSLCMFLPASGWSPIGTLGFRYKDTIQLHSPVKVALIKKASSGNFLLKVIATGTSISVHPGNPTATYGTNFEINGGDEYCASTGTAAPTKNDVKVFLVKNDDGILCTAPACSSPSGAFIDASATF